MKRAYSMSQWHRDFAAAFAASVPMEAMSTKARGPLLAADNDEEKTFAAIEADATAEARKAAEELEAAYLSADRARNEAKAADPLRRAEADRAQSVELSRTPMGGYLND
jgi:predicted ATPase